MSIIKNTKVTRNANEKFFKLLFSRFTLVVFAIILQLGLYIFLPIILNAFFPLVVNNAIVPLNIIIAIISMFVVIWIINSDITIEGQLPLIILCIIMPLIGIVVCMVFVKVHVPRKIKKEFGKHKPRNCSKQQTF